MVGGLGFVRLVVAPLAFAGGAPHAVADVVGDGVLGAGGLGGAGVADGPGGCELRGAFSWGEEPRRQLAAPTTATPPTHLRTHMHIHPRPHPHHRLDADDHDLTGEPADRLEHLADAHAVRSSLPFPDSSESRDRAACAPNSTAQPTPDSDG